MRFRFQIAATFLSRTTSSSDDKISPEFGIWSISDSIKWLLIGALKALRTDNDQKKKKTCTYHTIVIAAHTHSHSWPIWWNDNLFHFTLFRFISFVTWQQESTRDHLLSLEHTHTHTRRRTRAPMTDLKSSEWCCRKSKDSDSIISMINIIR